MKLQVNLSQKSISHLIGQLKKYGNSLESKTELFVSRLIDEGISVAYQHTGRYTGYVEFTKELHGGYRQCVGLLVGKDSKPFISTWRVKGGTKSVEVSGILMSEFGSGWLADVIWSVPGVGQGTFPGQTHATDQGGWWWQDEDGTRHHSIGEPPQYPMYSAEMKMLERIDAIAREVFNGI